jgi:hypothetical protein
LLPFSLLGLAQVLYFVELDIISTFTISSALLLAIFLGMLLLSITGIVKAAKALAKE